MVLTPTVQALQLTAWFLALLEFILGLYVLVLNAWHTANRHLSALLLLFAINNFAVGLILGATDASQIALSLYLLVATSTAVVPGLLLVTVVLLKPDWLSGRWRWVWWPVYGLVILPAVLTLVDAVLGTHVWFTAFDPATYPGGLISLSELTTSPFALLIRTLSIQVTAVATVVLLLYVLIRSTDPRTRRLAWLLVGAQVAGIVLQFGVRNLLRSELVTLITNAVFVGAYAYVAFRQMISESRLQKGRLQTRLTALILVIAIPILVAGILLVGQQASQSVEQSETGRLATLNRALSSNVTTWLNLSLGALQELALQPDMISMDPERQRPSLVGLDAAYPNVYLVSTTDLTGINVARSDNEAPKDYSDRVWFQQARDGAPVAFQVVVGFTSGVPALVVAVPIQGANEQVVGVAMFASTLSDVAHQVQTSEVGETGFAYIVDAQDQLIAHPDPALMTGELRDFKSQLPVVALRQGERGLVKFSDAEGRRWWAYVSAIDTGWGIVVQQQEAELLRSAQRFAQLSLIVIGIAVMLLLLLGWLTIRQAIRPISALTETAEAIAAGDLARTAPVESEDEIGMLAQTFNSMTAQLRDLIGSLEQRVQERTQDVERRAEYLAITGGVSRVVASILDLDTLLGRVVHLISERFGFYHVGIFLLDDLKEWAILRAVSSEGGERMLARGHRLRVGEQGIVGYVSSSGHPRIALDVDADVVWVKTPDLPGTRSEIALPLMVGEQVIGVLDVQSTKPQAFVAEDVATLRVLADQIAIAIQNARLFRESQRTLGELQRTYHEELRRGWAARSSPVVGYRYTPAGAGPILHSMEGLAETVKAAKVSDDNTLVVPLQLLGRHSFGALRLRRDPAHPWTTQEVGFVGQAAQDIAQALEVARLLEETRSHAVQDRLVGEIGEHLRATLDPDAILQATVRELGRVLGAKLTSIEITGPPAR